MTARSPPSLARSSAIASIAPATGSTCELGQVMSLWASVSVTTYLSTSFIWSANGSPARSGQASAMTVNVRRPNRSASTVANLAPIVPPMTSGSKNGMDQPPWANPPSVSSSGPPGAWTTPSRLMNSLTTTRIGRSCHL